ncbi:MAG: HipA N-terminal domain-containing protein [Flavobacteriales bacterium]|nr:HipA N-terminal domain-containing protein [Flavobacteriales bacterium]
MKNFLEKLFKNEEQPIAANTPQDIKAVFVLRYENLKIGQLDYSDGKWVFEYSNEFRHQNEVQPLVDFPDKEKRYEKTYLWPFFAHRIPGLGQPKVQRIIEKESLNPKNEVDLLKRFGQRSITNPFELGIVA